MVRISQSCSCKKEREGTGGDGGEIFIGRISIVNASNDGVGSKPGQRVSSGWVIAVKEAEKNSPPLCKKGWRIKLFA